MTELENIIPNPHYGLSIYDNIEFTFPNSSLIGNAPSIADEIDKQAGSSGLNQAVKSGSVFLAEDEEDGSDNKWEHVGILFDYIKEETSSVEAEITDNWVETNYTVQDHIAIKPRIYRISGCIGEVFYENVSQALNAFDKFQESHPVFQKTMNVVNGISAFSGIVSDYTKAAMNVVKQVESSYKRYKQIYDNFTKTTQIIGKRQAALYENLVAMMQRRKPVLIKELAYGEELHPKSYLYDKTFFIQSVSARQGDNAFISDIEVVIKEVRIAKTKTTQVDKKKFALPTQKTEQAELGKVNTETVPPKVVQESVNAVSEALQKQDDAINAVFKITNHTSPIESGKLYYNAFKSIFQAGAAINYNQMITESMIYNPKTIIGK